MSNAFLRRDDDDDRIWKPNPIGIFSVKSFYAALESSIGEVHPILVVWKGLVTPRVEVSCWLATARYVGHPQKERLLTSSFV